MFSIFEYVHERLEFSQLLWGSKHVRLGVERFQKLPIPIEQRCQPHDQEAQPTQWQNSRMMEVL